MWREDDSAEKQYTYSASCSVCRNVIALSQPINRLLVWSAQQVVVCDAHSQCSGDAALHKYVP
jgi:hypothetical protein